MHIIAQMNYQYTMEDMPLIADKARIGKIRQIDISKALKVSQSQISRALSGRTKGQSKLLHKICVYVNNRLEGISQSVVAEDVRFISAITEVWDGSDQQAEAICKIIRSLGTLCIRHGGLSKNESQN